MGRSRRQDRETERMLARALEAGRQLERQEMFVRTARQILTEEVREVAEAVYGGFPAALEYIRRAIPRWRERWRERMRTPLLTQMQTTELPTDRGPVQLGFNLANPKLGEFFETYTLRLATQITDTTRETLEEIIREASQEGRSVDETAERIRRAGEDFTERRARTIATTELHRAQIESQEIQARESGVITSRTWLSSKDSRVRELHRALDEKTVGMDEDFAPGVRSPAGEIQCRCSLIYNVDTEILGGAA